MAGITVARLVAHAADFAALISRQPMIIRKKWCVDISSERKTLIGFIVAVQTKPQVLPLFLNMPDGERGPLFGAACQKYASQKKRQSYLQSGVSGHMFFQRCPCTVQTGTSTVNIRILRRPKAGHRHQNKDPSCNPLKPTAGVRLPEFAFRGRGKRTRSGLFRIYPHCTEQKGHRNS